MTHDRFKFTFWNATTFFIPLGIQAASQSLTYPLVGAIVSHGKLGVLEFGAFSQGLIVMFLFGTLGYGMVTTGMMFLKDRLSYRRYRQVNWLLMFLVAGMQCLSSFPPFSTIIFDSILGLEGEQFAIARWTLFCSIPTQMSFFMRNLPQVVLYNEHKTSAATTPTLLRIAFTMLLSPLFCKYGLVGWVWGSVALGVPIVLEAALMYVFAYRDTVRLHARPPHSEVVTRRQLFFFNIPLSAGGFLLITSSFMLNAIINRTLDGPLMLSIHIIAMGLINPTSYAALRCQAVAIAFPKDERKTFIFSIIAGCGLALILLLCQIPIVGQWYLGGVQNLEPQNIPLAVHAILAAALIPLIQAIRGHAEGLAAYRKRPNAVLAGQAVFLGSLLTALILFYIFKMPGYLMGVRSLLVACVATFITVRLGLVLAQFDKPITSHEIR